MDKDEARRVLESHNRWRRGDDSVNQTDPADVGVAIEVAVRALAENPEASPLRDIFAGQALVGMMSAANFTIDIDGPQLGIGRAQIAYAMADAMIAAREGK